MVTPIPYLLTYDANHLRLSEKEASALKKSIGLATEEYDKIFLSFICLS